LKGNRSKGVRVEVVFAPELLDAAHRARGSETIAEFIRQSVRDSLSRAKRRA